MGISRIFIDQPLNSGELIELRENSAHHLIQVLRRQVQDPVVLFNGRGGEFEARIQSIRKSHVQAQVGAHISVERESPLRITLAQGISRGERMDYTLQKSVELGVSAIIPVQARRSTVRLDEERSSRRLMRWRKILISACEQCGRNRIPTLGPLQSLAQWLAAPQPGLKLLLAAEAKATLASLSPPERAITLLAGPEGGFSEEEQRAAEAAGYLPLRLGPRVLRTETAALAALAALQILWGDLADG